jgi:hypothetical protein
MTPIKLAVRWSHEGKMPEQVRGFNKIGAYLGGWWSCMINVYIPRL